MSVLKRLRYSLYILIASTMIVMLVLAVGEGIGLLHRVNVQGLMFHPVYISVVFAIGYALGMI